MALFKIHKGTEKNNDGTSKLPQSYVEGYAYFATDTGRFYIDTTNQASGRKMINPDAITNITRNGTTFTATKVDGSTITFTQQDNNTTYSAGTGISLSGTTFSLDIAGTKTALGLGSNAYTSTAYIAQSFGGTQYITNTTSSNDTSLCLKTNAEDSWLGFDGSGTMLGWIGFAGIGDLRVDTTSGVYNILHSGNYSSYVKTLTYNSRLGSDEEIDSFLHTNQFNIAAWNGTSSPGVSDGIILSASWDSSSAYGFQIAVDDNPTYYIALRQRDPDNGWKAWKRIPMGDGTGASGTWVINVSGNAATASALQGSGSPSAVPLTDPGAGMIKYYYNVNDGLTGNMPTSNNANGILYLNTHSGEYGYQLGFSSNGNIYYRYKSGSAFTTSVTWKTILDSENYTNYTVTKTGSGASGTWSISITGSALTATQDGNGNVISSTYLPLSGGKLTGRLQVDSTIFGYNYGNSNNAAAFIWDKPGGNYTGMGANSETDTIYFGACNSDGTWVADYRQKWKFNGSLIVGGGDDNCNIVPWTNNYSTIGTESLKWWKIYATYIYGDQVYGAVWNDYAEYRSQNEELKPGYIAYCDDDGKLKLTTERLQKFEGIVSDTFGFAIGETDDCKTPLAVSGRALVYCDPDDDFHSGDCVCAGPGGLAYRMTREEIIQFPDRIVGIVSEIPTYETWGTGNVEVNGRIWVKVR